jgi:2,3-bisphosphoglycerate-dependent phosphoglycerate mutase
MKILLIRHGQTTGDLENRYGGFYDDSLTEEGRQQLKETAKNLEGKKTDFIFSSSLKRAQESALILNEVAKARLEIMDGLRERNYGILGGLTKKEAIEKYPDVVELHKDPNNTDPEGESRLDFTNRVLSTFESITKHSYEQIIIVGHGGSIKTILKHLNLPLPDSIGDGEIIEVVV